MRMQSVGLEVTDFGDRRHRCVVRSASVDFHADDRKWSKAKCSLEPYHTYEMSATPTQTIPLPPRQIGYFYSIRNLLLGG